MIFSSRPFKYVKIIFTIMVGSTLYLDLPNKQLSEQEKNINFALNVLTFIFFFLEAIANMVLYGLVRNQHSYLRRSYLHILNLLILVVELLYLTPLSTFSTMHRVSRIRVLRSLFIIELRYRGYWEMRILIRSLKQLLIKFV